MEIAFKHLIKLILIVLVCASNITSMPTEAGTLLIDDFNSSSLSVSKQFPFGLLSPSIATTTVTNMLTITRTTKLSVTCAKLVNVTGACRRRRGMWQEEPIIISFDDNIDQSVQFLYTPVLDFMETTALPDNSNSSSVLPGGGYVTNSEEVIMSSQEDEYRQNFPVIQQVAGYVQSFLQQLRPSMTTITKTISIMKTVNTRKTSTATFYIQRCTPFPFRFSVCRNQRW